MERPELQPEGADRDAALEFDASRGLLWIRGAWTLHHIAGLEQRLEAVAREGHPELTCDARGLTALDTAGAWLLRRCMARWAGRGLHVELQGLRAEHAALLDMLALPAGEPVVRATRPVPGRLEALGRWTWAGVSEVLGLLRFIGESSATSLRLLLRPWRIRGSVLFANVQSAGLDALPIIGLLSFLVGVVISYQSAIQLRQYGANIYIADLVGLAMLRELAGLMTAIIVAGRSGSAFTAEIGTMQVTEEIDALRTVGIPPMELLVVPKMWALILALPLLTVFSDIMGVLGGMIMAQVQLAVGFGAFLDRFREAVSLTDFLVGVGKAPVFAIIIALVGCYQGFQVTGGADSVGRQTTVSVVQGIFLVIVADALFSIAFSWFGI